MSALLRLTPPRPLSQPHAEISQPMSSKNLFSQHPDQPISHPIFLARLRLRLRSLRSRWKREGVGQCEVFLGGEGGMRRGGVSAGEPLYVGAKTVERRMFARMRRMGPQTWISVFIGEDDKIVEYSWKCFGCSCRQLTCCPTEIWYVA